MNILRRAAVALILGLIGSAPVTAHNGAVAHAPALSGIVVDGDLSDWPQQTEWMPIALVEYGFGLEGLEGEDDLKAWHAIGYGDAGEVFYVAVKVEDDVWIDDPINASWNREDGVEVYFDATHHDHPTQLEFRGSQLETTLDGVVAVMRREGNRRTYEWRVPVRVLRGAAETGVESFLDVRHPLGYDVAVVDVDETDGPVSWLSWGPRGLKLADTENQGDVLPAGSPVGYGTMRLQIRWADRTPARRLRPTLREVGDSRSRRPWTDAEGRLEEALPAGRYTISVGPDSVTFAVSPDSVSEVSLVAHLSTTSAELGPGRTRSASGEITDDAWVTFGLPDGIPASAWTIAFADDGDGGIWFASTEGLTHFDRGRVTTYTPADGIPEQIHTLHLDRRDQLWLGSNDGLQRLEGNRIVTYLTTSQLPDGSGVQTIADDDEGNLWLGAGSGVTIYDGSSLRTYTGDDGVPGARALAAAGEGVWIGGSQ